MTPIEIIESYYKKAKEEFLSAGDNGLMEYNASLARLLTIEEILEEIKEHDQSYR